MRSERSGNARELIESRFVALGEGDFGRLYASYHPEAPFVEQFPAQEDYLAFAQGALAGIRVVKSFVGAVREADGGAEVICALHFELGGTPQTIFELALLLPFGEGFLYHSAQKLTSDEYSGGFADLSFAHFDMQAQKIRF